ncbi:hypothetical protein ACIBF6_18085 [Streptosporangium amethystogenes]|uniref:hypothetical protein n=1 Tax=Streptosporangium amethystogenes TaxID=2002 RepID=UPI0037B63996
MSRIIVRAASVALACVTALVLTPVGNAGATSLTYFTVRAAWGWQNTGVHIRGGQEYSVSYQRGSWTVDGARFSRVDADGYSNRTDASIVHGCKIIANRPYGTLIAKRGGGAFPVGKFGKYTAGYSGWLSLRINDGDFCLSDNAGSILVSIQVYDKKQSSGGGNGGNKVG